MNKFTTDHSDANVLLLPALAVQTFAVDVDFRADELAVSELEPLLGEFALARG